MIRSSARLLHRSWRRGAVNPFRIIQNRLEVTREQSSCPSSSVPRVFSPPNALLCTESAQEARRYRSILKPLFGSKPQCHRLLRGDRRTRTRLRVLFTGNNHQRWSTVANQLRGRFRANTAQAGCEAGLFFIATLSQKQRPGKAHKEHSATWPNDRIRPQSLIAHVTELPRDKNTYPRIVAFETGANSHARLLWQSR